MQPEKIWKNYQKYFPSSCTEASSQPLLQQSETSENHEDGTTTSDQLPNGSAKHNQPNGLADKKVKLN